MAPNAKDNKTVFVSTEPKWEHVKGPQVGPRKLEIVYRSVITFVYWHISAFYGLYLCFTSASYFTIIFNAFLYVLAQIGVNAGAHRLWSHKSYKASKPLQWLLMTMNSIAFQNTVIDWVRDHRVHHKYTDTDADPYNSSRGFFYSHCGWLMTRKSKEVIQRGKQIDISDVTENPVLKFQKDYAIPWIGSICFLLPTLAPMYLWGESFNNSWHICLLRYVICLNVTLSTNSISHRYGNRSYDKTILPTNTGLVNIMTLGEGFHNFHHAFPWDYRSSELGTNLFVISRFIEFFESIGWAYDMKTVTPEMVMQRMMRTGDLADLPEEEHAKCKLEKIFEK